MVLHIQTFTEGVSISEAHVGCNIMMVLVGFTVMLEKPMSADVPSCFTIAMVDQKLRSLEWLLSMTWMCSLHHCRHLIEPPGRYFTIIAAVSGRVEQTTFMLNSSPDHSGTVTVPLS